MIGIGRRSWPVAGRTDARAVADLERPRTRVGRVPRVLHRERRLGVDRRVAAPRERGRDVEEPEHPPVALVHLDGLHPDEQRQRVVRRADPLQPPADAAMPARVGDHRVERARVLGHEDQVLQAEADVEVPGRVRLPREGRRAGDPAAVVDDHGPERVVPGPLQQTLPPEPRVRLDRAVVRPRPAGEARHHVVEVAVGVHQADLRQVAPRRRRQRVERDPVRVPGPRELVAEAPVRLEHGGVQRRQRVAAVARHVHHGAHRRGGESRPRGARGPSPRPRSPNTRDPVRRTTA